MQFERHQPLAFSHGNLPARKNHEGSACVGCSPTYRMFRNRISEIYRFAGTRKQNVLRRRSSAQSATPSPIGVIRDQGRYRVPESGL
jgi:hypothetical protein